jgi:hypothetical protein
MLNDDGEDVAEELIRSSASDVDDLIIGRAAPCSDTQVGSMRPKPRLSVTMASLGIPLIEGHLAVAGSGLAFPLAAARETFANLPGIERREMSTESFSICDAAFGIHLKKTDASMRTSAVRSRSGPGPSRLCTRWSPALLTVSRAAPSGRDGGYVVTVARPLGLCSTLRLPTASGSRSGCRCSHPHESSSASCRVSFREIVSLRS